MNLYTLWFIWYSPLLFKIALWEKLFNRLCDSLNLLLAQKNYKFPIKAQFELSYIHAAFCNKLTTRSNTRSKYILIVEEIWFWLDGRDRGKLLAWNIGKGNDRASELKLWNNCGIYLSYLNRSSFVCDFGLDIQVISVGCWLKWPCQLNGNYAISHITK